MSTGAGFVPVYYSILGDPKFETVYGNNDHLATWVRLLLVHDAIWPANAPIPRTVRAASLKVLVAAGIVDLMPNDCFRIHGLDKERTSRAERARNAAYVRWQSTSNASAWREQSTSNADAMPTEPSLAVPSLTEPSRTNGQDDLDGWVTYFQVTGKYPAIGTALHDWIGRLASEHGADTFGQALALEHIADRDGRTLLSRTEARLVRARDAERVAQASEAHERLMALEGEKLRREQERRERLAAEPARPFAELMPDVNLGGTR